MVTIEITKSGVYGQNGPIPVGTVLDVPHEPTGWANKYRVVSDSKGKTLQPATPDHTPGNVPLNEVDEHAKTDEQRGTPDHALEAADELELSDLRSEYERIFGEKPHGRMKAETLRAKIEEEVGDE